MNQVKTHKVILYNTDDISFEYVMACLIQVCDHTPIQAEQCAVIAHNTGQVSIMSGSFDEMYNIKDILSYANMDASIEEYESNLYR